MLNNPARSSRISGRSTTTYASSFRVKHTGECTLLKMYYQLRAKDYFKTMHFFYLYRKVVAEAVRNLCCASVAERTGALSMDWLCGIPLYSFLTGKYEPYDDVCSTSDAALAERWSEMKNKFKLGEIKKKFESEKSKYVYIHTYNLLKYGVIKNVFLYRYVKQYYPMVKSLIDLDPLTLQAFVYICPDADLSDLFARIPPNVCTAWLAYMMTNLGYRSDNMNEVGSCIRTADKI